MKKLSLTLLLFFLPFAIFAQERLAQVTVANANHIKVLTPVSISLEKLPGKFQHSSLVIAEVKANGKIPIPGQVEQGSPARLWWLVTPDSQATAKRVFAISTGKPIAAPFLDMAIAGKSLLISQGQKNILQYNFGLIPPPENYSALFTRSGFIHPIWTPGGKILTRIHPSDHLHHLGFWHPWTKTKFEGRDVDFWNLGEGQGSVRFVRFTLLETGPVFARFAALQEFVDKTEPAREKVALNETWTVTVWNCSQLNSAWIWDFTTIQACATDSPLVILQYRYGGFGFRATAAWNDENSHVLTSEGKTRQDANGSRARWCQVYGQTDEGQAGLVFFSHPGNHNFPEPMRVWPQGDMFFGFCPVVDSDWKLAPGQVYERNYRMIVYDGEMNAAAIEQYWQAFAGWHGQANPPAIKVEWFQK